MPTYEYSCSCGNNIEEFRSIEDRSRPAKCSLCGSLATKVLSLTAEVQPPAEYDMTHVTGIKGLKARNAREVDKICAAYDQRVVEKSEFKNNMGRKPDIKKKRLADLKKIANDVDNKKLKEGKY